MAFTLMSRNGDSSRRLKTGQGDSDGSIKFKVQHGLAPYVPIHPERVGRSGGSVKASKSAVVQRARLICSRPTVSFHEDAVRNILRAWAGERGFSCRSDRWGNLHVGPVPPKGRGRPLVFTAHMDHPGFLVEGTRAGRSRCRFLGGVKPSYFRGAKVCVERWEDGKVRHKIRGRVLATKLNKRGRVESMQVLFDEPVVKGEIGTWDVPTFRRSGDVLWTRAADDLMGCAAISLALDRISKLPVSAPVRAVFTCAEEVGLVGATALAKAGGLPRGALVIVLETSKELPRARQGGGPVLRVGDIRSTFDPGVNHFLHETAKSLSSDHKSFRYQRCLMDGGTCEASSFGLFGYRVGALALPLRNYHNMGPKRVAAERIHLEDLRGMVTLLAGAAREAAKLPARGELPAGDVGGLLASLKLYRRDLDGLRRHLHGEATRRGRA